MISALGMGGLVLYHLDLKVDVLHGRLINRIVLDDFRLINLIVVSLYDG